MNGRTRQRVNRVRREGGEEKKKKENSLCAESCEINGRNGWSGRVRQKDGDNNCTAAPPGGFWEEVRGYRAWARFISEALLALKLRGAGTGLYCCRRPLS